MINIIIGVIIGYICSKFISGKKVSKPHRETFPREVHW